MTELQKVTEHMLKHAIELYEWQVVFTVPDDHLFRDKNGIIHSVYYNKVTELYVIHYEGGHSAYNLTGTTEVDIEAFQLLPIAM
jgi:hypothetical protein